MILVLSPACIRLMPFSSVAVASRTKILHQRIAIVVRASAEKQPLDMLDVEVFVAVERKQNILVSRTKDKALFRFWCGKNGDGFHGRLHTTKPVALRQSNRLQQTIAKKIRNF